MKKIKIAWLIISCLFLTSCVSKTHHKNDVRRYLNLGIEIEKQHSKGRIAALEKEIQRLNKLLGKCNSEISGKEGK